MNDLSDTARDALLEKFERGEDLPEQDFIELRHATPFDRWRGAQEARARNIKVLSLVSSGLSEVERAQAYRTKIGKQLDEVVKTINEARADGMTISFQIGPPDGFNRQSLVLLEIMKKLC